MYRCVCFQMPKNDSSEFVDLGINGLCRYRNILGKARRMILEDLLSNLCYTNICRRSCRSFHSGVADAADAGYVTSVTKSCIAGDY
jgi:hypothetical protein